MTTAKFSKKVFGFFVILCALSVLSLPAHAVKEEEQAPGLEAGAHKKFTPTEIVVSFNPSLEDSSWLADNQGFFKAFDLKAKLVPDAAKPQAAGFNLGVMDVVSFLSLASQGAPLFMVARDSNRDLPLVVKKDGGPGDVKALSGQKIAVPSKQSLAYLVALKALDKAGLKAADVEFVELAVKEMPAQLKGGQVAAIIGGTPWILEPLQQGWGKQLLTASELLGGRAYKNLVTNVVVASKKYQDQAVAMGDGDAWNNTLVRYLAALEKAALFTLSKKNRDKAIKAFAQETGASAKLVEMALAKYVKWPSMRLPRASHLQPWIKAMNEAGMLGGKVDAKALVFGKGSKWGTILRRYGVQKW